MPRSNRFKCRECGTTRKYADGGARSLLPCHSCSDVTTHERMERVEA